MIPVASFVGFHESLARPPLMASETLLACVLFEPSLGENVGWARRLWRELREVAGSELWRCMADKPRTTVMKWVDSGSKQGCGTSTAEPRQMPLGSASRCVKQEGGVSVREVVEDRIDPQTRGRSGGQ